MDNASIHHTTEVKALLVRAGVRFEYLPPYLPDFNPIKQTFNVLKAWIRRHIDEAAMFTSFDWFLRRAVIEALSDVKGHFLESRYNDVVIY